MRLFFKPILYAGISFLLLACQPDIESADPKERMRAIKYYAERKPELVVKIASTEKNHVVRKYAMDNIKDQSALAKIAMSSESSSIRYDALRKIRDQSILTRLVTDSIHPNIRVYILQHKLKDQALLKEYALENKDGALREAATKNVTDQAALVFIATSSDHEKVRRIAINRIKINNLGTLASTTENGDLLNKLEILDIVFKACSDVPTKRKRVCLSPVLTIVRTLLSNPIKSEIKLDSILAKWKADYANYSTGKKVLKADGEFLTIIVNVEKNGAQKKFKHFWKSLYPQIVVIRDRPKDPIKNPAVDPSELRKFYGASINEEQLLEKIFSILTQPALNKLAIENGDYIVRLSTIENITDKRLLNKIADKDSHHRVRNAAKEKTN